MEVFLGIPAADGTGIGTAFVIPDPVKRAIPQHHINIDQINRGWSRFEAAVQAGIFDFYHVQRYRLDFGSALCWNFP